MDLRRLQALETIDPKPLAPWREQPFVEIEIEPDREKAKESAATRRAMPGITIFSDASGQQNQLGAAAVALGEDLKASESRQVSIGSMEHWSVYAAELMAIYYAISLVYQISRKKRSALGMVERPATILSDSMSALQAIRNPSNRSGQKIIRATLQAASEMKARGIPIRLQWVPGHCDDPGNDEADRLAREAVGPRKMHPFQHLLSREKGFIRKKILNEWKEEWTKSTKGGHLRQIDKNLPSIRTRRLYGSLPRNRAYLLTQLRTGHSWLATYGKLHRFRDDDRCICGAQETVVHVLVDCPKLRDLRRELRRKIGGAFSNISNMLGGGQQGKEGNVQDAEQDSSTLEAVLDFAEASQRFRSRAPRGPQNRTPGN
jgi:ribonuclease HI